MRGVRRPEGRVLVGIPLLGLHVGKEAEEEGDERGRTSRWQKRSLPRKGSDRLGVP